MRVHVHARDLAGCTQPSLHVVVVFTVTARSAGSVRPIRRFGRGWKRPPSSRPQFGREADREPAAAIATRPEAAMQPQHKLITALRMLENKRDTMPPQKHGNIPL